MADIVKRYHLSALPSFELYTSSLEQAGLTRVYAHADGGEQIYLHFGMQLYTACEYKKDQFLGPDGISKEFYDYKVKGIESWLDYCE